MASLVTDGGGRDRKYVWLKEKAPVSSTTTGAAHKCRYDNSSDEIAIDIEERNLKNELSETDSEECPHCNSNNEDYFKIIQQLVKLRKQHKKTLSYWQYLYEKECVSKTAAINNRMTGYGDEKRTKDIYPTHKINVEFNIDEPYQDKCPIHEKDCFKNITERQGILQNVKNGNCFKKQVKRKKKKSPQYVKDNDYFDYIPASPVVSDDELLGENESSDLSDYIDYVNDILEVPLPGDCEPFMKMKLSPCRSCSALDKYSNNDWHHRITVPKPFSMTLRDANKEKKKSKTLLKFEKECEENKRQEECECKKTFKANPVPAHVFTPLYGEMMEKKDKERNLSHKNRKVYLESQQKPFTFVVRNKDQDKRPSSCMSFQESEKRKHKKFKDKCTPKRSHFFDKRRVQIEELRQLNILLKAQELGELPSTPKGLEIALKLMKENDHNNLEEKKIPFTPTIHDYIPDYEALYKQFQKEVLKKQKMKKPTVTQPFNFRTDDVALRRYIAKQEKHLFPENMDCNKQPTRQTKSLGCPDTTNVIPAKTTTSCQLRRSANLMKIENLNTKGMESDRGQHKHLKKEIKEKVRSNKKNPVSQNKIPTYLKQQKDYSKELEDIYERLKNRPLLFEQVERTNAKNKAEEKFYNTLKECGLDKHFIEMESRKKTKCGRLLDKKVTRWGSGGDMTKSNEFAQHGGNSMTQYEDFMKHLSGGEDNGNVEHRKSCGLRHRYNHFEENISDTSSEESSLSSDHS